MAGFLFNIGAERLILGTTVWGTSTFRARLVTTAAGAPNIDSTTMAAPATIGSTEVTASVAITDDLAPDASMTTNRVLFATTGDITFPAAATAIGPCNRMVIYHYNTNDAGSFPIACVDITAVTPNDGDITVTQPVTNSEPAWYYLQQ